MSDDQSLVYSMSISNYKLHNLELSEYTRILPKLSHLEVCIYIDECRSFERWQHPLWAKISKGDPYFDLWAAISISEKPKVITSSNKDISSLQLPIKDCMDFISKFHHLFKEIALEVVDSGIIYEILTLHDWRDLSPKGVCDLQTKFFNKYSLC